jgi:hypothetical protein
VIKHLQDAIISKLIHHLKQHGNIFDNLVNAAWTPDPVAKLSVAVINLALVHFRQGGQPSRLLTGKNLVRSVIWWFRSHDVGKGGNMPR